MNKKAIILSLILIIFSGCIGTETKETYNYQDGSNFTLFDDGTVYMFFARDNMGYTGIYRTEGNDLYITFPLGNTEKMTKEGNAYIDKDGWRWEHGR